MNCRTALAILLLAAGCGKSEPAAPVGGSVLVPSGAFHIDRTPVTQEQYEKVMGVNPAKRKDPKSPVAPVRWTDAVRFCNRTSELEGLAPCYDLKTWECDFAADGYRLPTEAEWELACRAGSTAKYSFGDDLAELGKHAWFKGNSEGKTHPVGQKPPNLWGLYDMHGNVWQWCQDEVDKGRRALRGGSWDSTAEKCAASYRAADFPAFTDACFGSDSYGFRRVRSATPTRKAGAVRPVPVQEPPPPKAGVTIELVQGKGKSEGFKGTIVFVSDRGGALDIWRMHASGRDAKPLTKDAHPDADPRFSPDGKRILYTTLRGGFPEVWVMSRDGSDPKPLTKGSQACWSPDGGSILFVRDNQAHVRELGPGRERRVTPESWERCGVPAWSPDGKRIAVASRHEEAIGIYLLSLDGKENVPLKTPEPACTPCWSKDGKLLLFQTTKGHIHQIGADGKDEEQLTFGADVQHDARWSPDGSMIVFCRAPTPQGPWQICVSKAGDEDFVALTKEGSNSLPDWHVLED